MNPVAPIRRRRAALVAAVLLALLPLAQAANPASQVRKLAARTLMATATLRAIGAKGLAESGDPEGAPVRRERCTELAREALGAISAVAVDPASTDDVVQLSSAVDDLLGWIEDNLTPTGGSTPLLEERSEAVNKCVAVAERFADRTDPKYSARLQTWRVYALGISVEKSARNFDDSGDWDWRPTAREWTDRLGKVRFDPDSDSELARSVRTAAGKILAFPSWKSPVETDAARLADDSNLRVELLKAALKSRVKLDSLRSNLGDAAAAAVRQGGDTAACMLWDLLQLATAIHAIEPDLWNSSESSLWEQLLQLHFHRVTVAAHAIDQANTRPRRSDWEKGDRTGADGDWFEFDPAGPIGSGSVSVAVHGTGETLLAAPDVAPLGWTDFVWAVPAHPHWLTVTDKNGVALGIVARWEGSARRVRLALPETLPDGMVLLHGIGTGDQLLACATARWRRSRLAELLLGTLSDPIKALQAILRANEVAVRDDARGEIQATAESARADGREFKLSEVEIFHEDLLASESTLLLPTRELIGNTLLGWTKSRLGWESDALTLVTRTKPTDASRDYEVRNLIEIAVQESSR